MMRFILDTGPAQQFINNRNGVRDRAELERRKGILVGNSDAFKLSVNDGHPQCRNRIMTLPAPAA